MTLAFTVPVTGTLRRFTGRIAAEAYTAEASLLLSDVDISGEVAVRCPEAWLMQETSPEGEQAILYYQLVADGTVYKNLNAYMGTGGGVLTLGLRFDVPEDAREMALRPVYSDGRMPEGEDILLEEVIH